MITHLRRLAPVLAVALLCQCGAPQPPQCHRVPMGSRAPAATLLGDARREWAILADSSRRDEWSAARTRYNTAVAKLFDHRRCGPDGWDSRAAAIGTRIGAVKDQDVDPRVVDVLFPAALVSTR